MKASLPLFMLLLASCGGDPSPASSSAGPADANRVRDILARAASDPQEGLRPSLERLAEGIGDLELRTRVEVAIQDLVDASILARRASRLTLEMTELGGLTAFEPGGPDWMRRIAGDGPMRIYDRLVSVRLDDKTNPHSKGYHLNMRINDAWLERLAGLPNLRSLDIANTDVHGPGLRFLSDLSALESINLTLLPIHDDALGALSRLTRLKSLGLASTKVTGTGTESLGALTQLENLNCHNTPVDDAGLRRIGRLQSLKRLEIVHTHFTDAGAPALGGLIHLERLHLGSRTATGAALRFLDHLTRLRELDVHDGLLSPEGWAALAGAKELRVLRGYGGSGGDQGLSILAGLPHLETVVLEGTGVTDAGLESLARAPQLKSVTIHEGKVTPAGLARLRALRPGLEVAR